MPKTELPKFRNNPKFPEGALSYKKTLSRTEQKLINDYVQYRAIKAQSKTRQLEYQRILLMLRFVLDKPLTSAFTLKDVEDFLRVLYKAKRSDEEKKRTGETLFTGKKSFFKWKFKDWSSRFNNFEESGGDRMVSWKVKSLQDKYTDSDMISEKEVELLLEKAISFRDKCLLMLAFETGCRPQELRELKWKDVDFQNKAIRVLSTKTGKPRDIPLDKSILLLKEWRQHYPFSKRNEEDLVYPSEKDSKIPMTRQGFSYIFKSSAKRAGIKKNVFGYLFRHSAISRWQDSDVNINSVMAVAGHSNINTTLRYTHLNKKKALQEIVKKVYQIEEISQEQQNKYDEEIQVLKDAIITMHLRKKGAITAKEEEKRLKALTEEIDSKKG